MNNTTTTNTTPTAYNYGDQGIEIAAAATIEQLATNLQTDLAMLYCSPVNPRSCETPLDYVNRVVLCADVENGGGVAWLLPVTGGYSVRCMVPRSEMG